MLAVLGPEVRALGMSTIELQHQLLLPITSSLTKHFGQPVGMLILLIMGIQVPARFDLCLSHLIFTKL